METKSKRLYDILVFVALALSLIALLRPFKWQRNQGSPAPAQTNQIAK